MTRAAVIREREDDERRVQPQLVVAADEPGFTIITDAPDARYAVGFKRIEANRGRNE